MIICSCNAISDKAIREIVAKLIEKDPNALLTPGVIYRELGFRADCGTCLTNTIELIINEIDHPSHSGGQVIQLYEQREKLKKRRIQAPRSIKTSTHKNL